MAADPADPLAAVEALRGIVVAFVNAMTEWSRQIAPVLAAFAKSIDTPEMRAALERATPQEVREACHCLCILVHPDRPGICDTWEVRGTRMFGDPGAQHSVTLCAPCMLEVDTVASTVLRPRAGQPYPAVMDRHRDGCTNLVCNGC